jgi:peptidoglycan hydrolase-like protein with peptidoglycan-binding domain
VVTVGNRSISISWSAVTGATGYEYSLDGGHSWSKPTTHRSVTVAGLQNGHAYSVRVRALTGTVAGAASVAVSGTPQQPVAAAPALPPLQQQGSRGSDVARIQRLLGIPADGIFGPQTAGAVRAFQLAHHLQVDGIVGRQTWTALLSGTSTAPASRPWLRFGSTGSYVRELQQRLGGLAVDGIFGPKTRAGVFAFQSSHHLMVDGIVGTQTWAALPAR